ncbi:MAG: threonylcarbamoyl-AMP synthase [Legionellales bacterium]|nr:threonylcarbamoyl-AMP synthase [Legionellales bacterium]|tara:strand:- start:229 stop:849 length:621 start_codon:yes stop_codon:yes gene_type:complete
MSQFFQIHPDNPQARLIEQAAEVIHRGGVIAYPTDSTYALGCHMGDKQAVERLRKVRQLDDKHPLTLMCRDLRDLGTYARVSNSAYRMLKSLTPGPFTFLLQATKEVPRRVLQPKKKTIGIRVPSNPVSQALLAELGEPMISTTLQLPGDEYPMLDPYEIRDCLQHQLDLVIDGGYSGLELTTVIDLSDDYPELLREGLGDASGYF